MAQRPWERLRGRKRDDKPDGAGQADDETTDGNVNLDSDDNAWWAKRDVQQGYTSPQDRPPRPSAPTEAPRDTFRDYFTNDSLFDHSNAHASGEGDGADGDEFDVDLFHADDPYVVLGVPSTSTWEQITDAHRRLAKLHHPDRLLHATEEDRERSETRMRDINIAYSELRHRRGK